MFMYYFDGDTAPEPQGIIDMEYCTDIQVEKDNIIKIGASEEFQRYIWIVEIK